MFVLSLDECHCPFEATAVPASYGWNVRMCVCIYVQYVCKCQHARIGHSACPCAFFVCTLSGVISGKAPVSSQLCLNH